MFAFVLFLILGIAVFWVPVSANGRIVLLVVFVVLMLLWALQGGGVLSIPNWGKW